MSETHPIVDEYRRLVARCGEGGNPHCPDCERMSEIETQFTKALQASRWRTVGTDGPPDPGVRVLVKDEFGELAFLLHRDGWWSDGTLWESGAPSDRWLPVPEDTP